VSQEDDATKIGQLTAEELGLATPYGMERPYYGRYARNQPGVPYPPGAYYGMTQKAPRDRDIAIVGGLGLLGAGIQRYLQSKEADTAGVKYARDQIARIDAELEAPVEKVSADEKQAMIDSATAPVRTEIEESKSNIESYLASAGRTANVEDLAATRDIGTRALADAPLKVQELVTDKNLRLRQAKEAKDARLRAERGVYTGELDRVQVQQLKYDQALVGDIVKVGLTAMASKVAQDQQPAVDRLIQKGASGEDIRKLHKKAIAAGFPPGSRAYDTYMMTHYEGVGGRTDKQTKAQKKATGVPAEGDTVTPTPGIRELRAAEATVRAQQAGLKQPAPVTDPNDPRLFVSGDSERAANNPAPTQSVDFTDTSTEIGKLIANVTGKGYQPTNTGLPIVLSENNPGDLNKKVGMFEANYNFYTTPPGTPKEKQRFVAILKGQSYPGMFPGLIPYGSAWTTP
tara:strand:+ start:2582 stop:3955 length:1374 start_codon:yes stop_codon:yes gene_type:complete